MKLTSILSSLASALVAATGVSGLIPGLGGMAGLGGMGGMAGLGGMAGMGGLGGMAGLGGMGGMAGMGGLGGMAGMGGMGGMGGLGGAGLGGGMSPLNTLLGMEGGYFGELGLFGKGREGLRSLQEGSKKKDGGGNAQSKFRTSMTGLGSGFDNIVGSGRGNALGVGGGLGRGASRRTKLQNDLVEYRRNFRTPPPVRRTTRTTRPPIRRTTKPIIVRPPPRPSNNGFRVTVRRGNQARRRPSRGPVQVVNGPNKRPGVSLTDLLS